MLNWWEKWGLHPDVCPCDVHFNEWVEAHGISNKLIYHFGTGTHHVIGRRQAELGSGNVVFGITASKGEYEDYIALVIDNAAAGQILPGVFRRRLSQQSAAAAGLRRGEPVSPVRILFRQHREPEYGGLDDRELLDVFTAKTRPGGHILFYTGSNGISPRLSRSSPAWEKEQPVDARSTISRR